MNVSYVVVVNACMPVFDTSLLFLYKLYTDFNSGVMMCSSNIICTISFIFLPEPVPNAFDIFLSMVLKCSSE